MIGFLVLLLLVTDDFVLESILEEHLSLFWEGRESLGEIKVAALAFENNFKDHRDLIISQVLECKLDSNVKLLARAGVARQVNFPAGNVIVDFGDGELDPAIQHGRVGNVEVRSVLCGAVENEA